MATGTEFQTSKSKSRWTWLVWGAAAAILATPLAAMRFTSEVNWTLSDFIVMGFLLGVCCGIIEMAARFSGSAAYKLGVCAAVGGGLLITWANLAVGHEHGPVHLGFYIAILTGLAGSAIARFKARGMAVAMMVTAAAMAVALRLFILSMPDPEGPNLLVTVAGSLAIASPFLTAAWLFRTASRQTLA